MSLLKWALIFLVIAVIAGVLGFTNVAGASVEIARFLFYVFAAIVVIMVVLGVFVFGKVAGP